MKEKLTLEDLAPYLPYNAKVKGEYVKRIIDLTPKRLDFICSHDTTYKIILRTMSDLNKEIVHNGLKIHPMHELAKIEANGFKEIKGNCYVADDFYCIDYSDSFGMNTLAVDIVNIDFSASRGFITDSCRNQLKLFNWLYKHHFAINIPEHLYIDINTLK